MEGKELEILKKIRHECLPIFKAVKRYATVGEICNVLRDVDEEYGEGKIYFT